MANTLSSTGIALYSAYSGTLGLLCLTVPHKLSVTYGVDLESHKHSKESIAALHVLMSRYGFILTSWVGVMLCAFIFGNAKTRGLMNFGIVVNSLVAMLNVTFNFMETFTNMQVDTTPLKGNLVALVILALLNYFAWISSGFGVPGVPVRPATMPNVFDLNYTLLHFASAWAIGLGVISAVDPSFITTNFGFADVEHSEEVRQLLVMFSRGIGMILVAFVLLVQTALASHHPKTINFATMWVAMCCFGWMTLFAGQDQFWYAIGNQTAPVTSSYLLFVHTTLLISCLVAVVRAEAETNTELRAAEVTDKGAVKEEVRPKLAKSHAS